MCPQPTSTELRSSNPRSRRFSALKSFDLKSLGDSVFQNKDMMKRRAVSVGAMHGALLSMASAFEGIQQGVLVERLCSRGVKPAGASCWPISLYVNPLQYASSPGQPRLFSKSSRSQYMTAVPQSRTRCFALSFSRAPLPDTLLEYIHI